jgi:predicted SprT family Zn-dependent metalloprotease
MNDDCTIQTADDADDDDLVEFPSPTAGTYSTFNEAYAHFNDTLFGNDLPDTLITLQRRRKSRGYFSPQRFSHRRGTGEILDEVALNPAAMQDRSDEEIASTLVHEMVHVWQEHFGKPGRGRYHNKQWAAKMEQLGLMPSHTGQPGGKRTGQAVSHYVIEGGPFSREWKFLADECNFTFDYQDRLTNGPETVRKNRARYACPACSIHVWGKPELAILCETCGERMR